jgi:hypothetical protein
MRGDGPRSHGKSRRRRCRRGRNRRTLLADCASPGGVGDDRDEHGRRRPRDRWPLPACCRSGAGRHFIRDGRGRERTVRPAGPFDDAAIPTELCKRLSVTGNTYAIEVSAAFGAMPSMDERSPSGDSQSRAGASVPILTRYCGRYDFFAFPIFNQLRQAIDTRRMGRSGFHLWPKVIRLDSIKVSLWRTRDETASGHCDHNWRSYDHIDVRRADHPTVDGYGRASSTQPLCARPGMLSQMQK